MRATVKAEEEPAGAEAEAALSNNEDCDSEGTPSEPESIDKIELDRDVSL